MFSILKNQPLFFSPFTLFKALSHCLTRKLSWKLVFYFLLFVFFLFRCFVVLYWVGLFFFSSWVPSSFHNTSCLLACHRFDFACLFSSVYSRLLVSTCLLAPTYLLLLPCFCLFGLPSSPCSRLLVLACLLASICSCHCYLAPTCLFPLACFCHRCLVFAYFCHCCLLVLVCFWLFLSSSFACFRHRWLFIFACFHHCRMSILVCSYLFSPSPFFRYFIYFHLFYHLFACCIVCLFELRAHPPCLVIPCFFVCVKGGT